MIVNSPVVNALSGRVESDWLDDVQKMDSETLASLMQMGAKVQKLLEMKDRVKSVFTPAKPSTEGADHGQL